MTQMTTRSWQALPDNASRNASDYSTTLLRDDQEDCQ